MNAIILPNGKGVLILKEGDAGKKSPPLVKQNGTRFKKGAPRSMTSMYRNMSFLSADQERQMVLAFKASVMQRFEYTFVPVGSDWSTADLHFAPFGAISSFAKEPIFPHF